MSKETKEAEFGGWRKKRGKQVYEPKEGHPYVVAATDGELGYSATLTGDNPALLQMVPTDGCTDKQALKAAQDVCEQHWRDSQPEAAKLGVATCQEHHRELVGPPEIGERDVKPEKPAERELVTRSILCDLTPDELAQVGLDLAKADEKAENLEADLTRLKETFAEQRKSLEGSIEGAKVEKRRLRGLRLTGQEYRELQVHEQLGPDPGDGTARELIFTDPETGEVLDSRPATKSELQKWLPQCGGPDDPPADKPPSKGDELLDELDAAINIAATSAGLDEADPLPPDLNLSDRRSWTKFVGGSYTAGDTDGEHYAVGKGPAGLWVVHYTPAGPRPCKPRELPGKHTRLRDAFAAAHADNQHRVRWPAQTMICLEHLRVIITVCGRYQLHQIRGLDDSWPDAWRAELVGVLGQPNTQLNSDDGQPLLEAQAACQHHADAGRAGQ
jgi:hypothetical protein